ncbi:hypothetical protein ACFFSW_18000 [Saccharothrix longispora]|uniref:Uncharacterized protein n=1 Tax=Saccharothrix longispora TaxID=33920 RepID=A0ABU1PST7_9PSEU|nr:hypothetical protein [Saccharothrix longispora]MDR6593526.1 hypothetical protein [Saccharothrix longispora]MDU0289716.1 hypothetical protein [Saccharothrix longispora]
MAVFDDVDRKVFLAGTSSGGTDHPTGDEEMDFHQPDEDLP